MNHVLTPQVKALLIREGRTKLQTTHSQMRHWTSGIGSPALPLPPSLKYLVKISEVAEQRMMLSRANYK